MVDFDISNHFCKMQPQNYLTVFPKTQNLLKNNVATQPLLGFKKATRDVKVVPPHGRQTEPRSFVPLPCLAPPPVYHRTASLSITAKDHSK